MKSNLAKAATYDLLSDDHDEEISSIRKISSLDLQADVPATRRTIEPRFDMEVDVDILTHRLDRGFDEPTPVYARPFILIGGERCDFPRGTYLGTRFSGGIIESASWEQEIRAAGVSESVVARCRRFLSDHAL